MFVKFNPNPIHKRVGDCVIRAISKALDQTWEQTYAGVVLKGFELADMPSANHVWGAYLRDKGFARHIVSNDADGAYTVEDFARDHPQGTFILAMNGHVVCVRDGDVFDTWRSENELPIYYWTK